MSFLFSPIISKETKIVFRGKKLKKQTNKCYFLIFVAVFRVFSPSFWRAAPLPHPHAAQQSLWWVVGAGCWMVGAGWWMLGAGWQVVGQGRQCLSLQFYTCCVVTAVCDQTPPPGQPSLELCRAKLSP